MKYFFKIKFTLLSLIILLLLSCEKDKMLGDVVLDNELREYLYSKSNDTILIEPQKLVLETELYRNFFPGGMPEKRRLVAYLNVRNIDSLPVTNILDVTNLYVINNEQIWISTPKSGENAYIPDFILNRISIDGPEWETNTHVDVIVEIMDFSNSSKYYLIARDQLIVKVE